MSTKHKTRVATETAICRVEEILPDTGVGALVGDAPVAVFRLSGIDGAKDEICAIDAVDPFTKVPVLFRWMVGSVKDEPFVAAPLYKQRFRLRDGLCLDDEEKSVVVYDVRVDENGIIFVAPKEVSTPET